MLAIRALRTSKARLPQATSIRRYANDRRSKLQYRNEYNPNTTSSFIQQKPGASSLHSSAPNSKAKSTKDNDFSERQPEVDSGATPERNSDPIDSYQPPKTSKPRSSKQSSENDFTTKEDAFGGPQSAEANQTANGEDVNTPGTSQGKSQPLPDLRQGIPSTFAKEFMDQANAANAARQATGEHEGPNVTEDPNNPNEAPGSSGRGGAELPKSAYETSTDRRRNQYANWSALAMVLLGGAGAVYYGRNWDTEEEERMHPEAPSGWSFGLFWGRIRARWGSQMSYYTEPTFPKLLPELDPAPPYTLVLSLEDLLVHSEWTREHGWRTAKRPGLDYFLRYLCQYYEIVLFTSLPMQAADPIIKKLDPLRLTIMWPLFREATRYENGEYVKDLSYLNRDLSRVIMIDTKQHHAKYQPENAIILPGWKGTAGDKGLVSLIPFLEYIAAMGIPDVRKAIKSFEGTDIPTEFARREAIQREAFNKQLAEENAKKPKRSASTWVANALGLKPQGGLQLDDGQSVAEGLAQGKMFSDQARERGQKQYELMEKEIRENSAKWLQEQEAMDKAQQEEFVKGMKSSISLSSLFGMGKSSPNDSAGSEGK